jgi:hypothetical protein
MASALITNKFHGVETLLRNSASPKKFRASYEAQRFNIVFTNVRLQIPLGD